ncbi:hypothetical protein EYB53_000420 [Candidatus Chloroploca sp. M-50]|uniref:Uncharacterized protein n=1 Tax=Candidatus Chloroploca mongolica TaxID=2528176 RepID=A0ABS4D411_9CHLR|nr:hypothetical protein [Candidatus Chloroploca mongolica]MBP1464159.1 hypothetical protein [Candidatus Chloroploca mongolica]
MHKRRMLILNALTAALLGALGAQILHEACHGVTAVLVGAEWQAFNLFAVLWDWPGTPNETGTLLVEALPALLNILLGFLGVILFHQSARQQRSMAALFWMYVAGYNLFMGFGYLFVDPLFYQSGREQVGDWQKVVDSLGGSWAVRLPILLVGACGLLWGFFWLARAALRFATDASDKAERLRVALPLLLVPYLVFNVLFTVLAIWHPLGWQGVIIVALQYWFGYVGFFWGFFLAAYWLDVHAPLPNPVPLPDQPQPVWWLAAGLTFLFAVAVLLPTVWLG